MGVACGRWVEVCRAERKLRQNADWHCAACRRKQCNEGAVESRLNPSDAFASGVDQLQTMYVQSAATMSQIVNKADESGESRTTRVAEHTRRRRPTREERKAAAEERETRRRREPEDKPTYEIEWDESGDKKFAAKVKVNGSFYEAKAGGNPACPLKCRRPKCKKDDTCAFSHAGKA